MERKKIIIVGPAFPLRGGIANFNEALCKALIDEGNDCSMVSFSMQYPSFLFPGKTQYDTGENKSNLTIATMINSVNPISWVRTANFINKQNPDFVIFRFWIPFMAPCLGTIARLLNKKIKIIAITDNIIPHEKRPGDKALTSYFIKSCDAFITLSQQVLNELKTFDNVKPALFTPHPVYDIFGDKVSKAEARERLKLDPNTKYILFFGFIRKYKGLDLLLEAMADERVRNHKIKLIIAGEYYEDASFYQNLIASLGIKNDVLEHSHFIDSEDVKYYFCAADLIVQPYRSATQSGVTQIAYHFERPMLVTDVGGLSEIVIDGKTGYVCATDKNAIANAIVDFYESSREQAFVANCKEEKKRFSWSFFVEKMNELYDKISIKSYEN